MLKATLVRRLIGVALAWPLSASSGGGRPIVPANASQEPSPPNSARDVVFIDDFGAPGGGDADEFAAIQAAVNTGKTVRCRSGSVHVTDGGIIVRARDQLIDFTGCSIKLKARASRKGLLQLQGQGARVTGGAWDLNAAENQTRATADDGGYGVWAILSEADGQTVEGLDIKDSAGLAVKAVGVSKLTIRNNRIARCRIMGVYVEGRRGADTHDVVVEQNDVDFTDHPDGAQGIGIYSLPGSSIRGIRVTGNHVAGPEEHSSPTSVAITLRGAQSIVSGNMVRGSTIGISVDRSGAQDCVITSNYIAALSGATSYGVELNGGRCTVANNVISGVRAGIVGSSRGTMDSIDDVVITGNSIQPSERGIYFVPGPGATAHHITIIGNTVVLPRGARSSGISLARDCRFALIEANVLVGPGSATPGSRAVYLDSVDSDVAIRGNRISGFERAVALYSATPTAQERIVFSSNDVSGDVPANAPETLLNLEGAAVAGAALQALGNVTGAAGLVRYDEVDRRKGLRFLAGDGADPEGVLRAGPGSTWTTTSPEQESGNLYVKSTPSTVATGWLPVFGRRAQYAGPFRSIRAGRCADFSVEVRNAAPGATCAVGAPPATPDGLQATCYVQAANAVTLRVCNLSGSAATPVGSFSVRVFN